MNAVYDRSVMPISPDAFVVNALIHDLTRDEILGYMRLLGAFWCRGGPICPSTSVPPQGQISKPCGNQGSDLP